MKKNENVMWEKFTTECSTESLNGIREIARRQRVSIKEIVNRAIEHYLQMQDEKHTRIQRVRTKDYPSSVTGYVNYTSYSVIKFRAKRRGISVNTFFRELLWELAQESENKNT